ncbi:MAG: alginate lyase family protein [Lentisphaerae bacterium]|nr:alginate lyase family protein [Lentisphaerota bacterium]
MNAIHNYRDGAPFRRLTASPFHPGFASLGLVFLALSFPLLAAFPPEEKFCTNDVATLLDAVNGTVEMAGKGEDAVIRWRVNPGQTSTLSLREDHPIFSRLRYYDRLEFEFRLAAGEISEMNFAVLGHVSGPRQHKIHEWHFAVRTVTPELWHFRQLELARPNWFPWDNPDGESGSAGFFHFTALAIASDTVIELRNVRLVRNLILLKPYYEWPITWPVKRENADGGATYAMTFQMVNAGGKPTEIKARVLSAHPRFTVAFATNTLPVKSSAIADFTLTAILSKADMAATAELYEEPVRVGFAPVDHPEAEVVWEGLLVRPLSKTLKRQVVVPSADIEQIRAALKAGNAEVGKLADVGKIVAAADRFMEKRLDHIPGGHAHVINAMPPAPGSNRTVEVGSFMPEIVDPKGGFREAGTDLAGQAWKEYLGQTGHACEDLGMAYLLTGDEKYAKKAIELLLLYAGQYGELEWFSMFDPPWNRGPAMLCSSRIAGSSTYGSNWYMKGLCRLASMIAESPSWTEADKQRIYDGFVLAYVTEIAKFYGNIINMTDITHHNILLLGLVFDDAHMVRWATKTDAGILTRLRDIDADGFSSEGRPLNYHGASMTEYLPALGYLAHSGLTVDFPRERLAAALRMPYQRATLWGRVPSSGDCGRGQSVGLQHLADDLLALCPDEQWLYDISPGSTLQMKYRNYRDQRKPDMEGWKKLLETAPRLFSQAGMAILRTGKTPEDQIMVTLDYGRNVMHSAFDRNQITLAAFGKTFTHGPGSTYNAGSGWELHPDPRLRTFCSHGSLGQNVVLVDMQDQLSSVGTLLAWSPKEDFQVAVSRVEGIQPGVAHVRGVALTDGMVLMLDRLESSIEHVYDFAYHNVGELTLGEGWTAKPMDRPLGSTANYENIAELNRLTGSGSVRLNWDLDNQIEKETTGKNRQTKSAAPARLALWQWPNEGELYTGLTGMINPNTAIIGDAAPSLFHRIRGKTAEYMTVLEPHKGVSRIAAVDAGAGQLTVSLTNGKKIVVNWDDLIKRYAVKQ